MNPEQQTPGLPILLLVVCPTLRFVGIQSPLRATAMAGGRVETPRKLMWKTV